MKHSGRYVAPPRPKQGELKAYHEFMKKESPKMPKTDKPIVKSIKPVMQEWGEPGTHVEGRLVARDFVNVRIGTAIKYTVELLEGDGRVSFFAGAILAPLLDPLPLGTYVEILQLEGGSGTHGKYYDFDVWSEEYESRHKVHNGQMLNSETGELADAD